MREGRRGGRKKPMNKESLSVSLSSYIASDSPSSFPSSKSNLATLKSSPPATKHCLLGWRLAEYILEGTSKHFTFSKLHQIKTRTHMYVHVHVSIEVLLLD